MIEGDANCPDLGDPGARRRQPRVLRSDERLGPGRGAARLGVHLLGARARTAPGRLRRTSALSGPQRSARSSASTCPTASCRKSSSRTAAAKRPAAGRRRVLRRRRAGDHGQFAAVARQHIAEELGLVARRYRFCWVVDFPMYEWDEQTKQVTFSHNPFSLPQGGLEALETKDPLEILAYQYDIVRNGIELSSGALRATIARTSWSRRSRSPAMAATLEARFGGMFRVALRRAAARAWRRASIASLC